MAIKLYRKIVPYSIRKYIYDLFLENILYFIRNFSVILQSKISYYFYWFLPKTEINNVYKFMGKHGITSYPYDYMLEYKKKDVQIFVDDKIQLPFVIHNNRKLYFRKSTDFEKLKSEYLALLIEQDPRSAHRYVNSYSELKNRSLLDVGCAEAIFSLDSIDYLEHLYLFEYNDEWMIPLQATFSPWKDKVTIIKKMVGNITSESQITIDDFLNDKINQNLFIKMDIEGSELVALNGALKTLKSGLNIQLAVCTYHRKGDPEIISDLLSSIEFQNEFTNGLMYWDKKFSKGILRSKK